MYGGEHKLCSEENNFNGTGHTWWIFLHLFINEINFFKEKKIDSS